MREEEERALVKVKVRVRHECMRYDRERETNRQAGKQTDRQIESQRETEREREGERERETTTCTVTSAAHPLLPWCIYHMPGPAVCQHERFGSLHRNLFSNPQRRH